MIPGLVTKLSEAIISLANSVVQKTDVIRVSSTATTTVLVTLTPALGGKNALVCFLVNSSGAAITTTTAGNFATTCSIPNNCMATFVFSPSSAKWHLDKTT